MGATVSIDVRGEGSGAQHRTPQVWAYAYHIEPQLLQRGLHTVRSLLEQEHAAAQREARTWTGRLEAEPEMTRILIVSDLPERNREINQRLEAALRLLSVNFFVTEPTITDSPMETSR